MYSYQRTPREAGTGTGPCLWPTEALHPQCAPGQVRAEEAERLRLTSRDGIKDGDFPGDHAHWAASLDGKDAVIELVRPFLCSICSHVPTLPEFSHLGAFSFFFLFFWRHLELAVFLVWRCLWTWCITVGDVGLACCAHLLIKRNLAYL